MADTKDVTVPRQWEPVVIPPQGCKIGVFGKGGAGKTTTLAHVTAHWAADSIPCGAMDSDEPGEHEDGSLYTWSKTSSLGAPVRKAPANHDDLDVELDLYLPAGGILGLDTPAWERKPETIHLRALSLVNVAVLCLQPTGMELNRAGSLLSAIKQIEAVGGRAPKLVILLTRTKSSANAADQSRDALAGAKYHVLTNEMPDQHAMDGYGQSFPKPVRIDFTSPLGKLSRELAGIGAAAVSGR